MIEQIITVSTACAVVFVAQRVTLHVFRNASLVRYDEEYEPSESYLELVQELHEEVWKCTKIALFLAYLPKESLMNRYPFEHSLRNHTANVNCLEIWVKKAWIKDFANI